jgi:hypothetical protein
MLLKVNNKIDKNNERKIIFGLEKSNNLYDFSIPIDLFENILFSLKDSGIKNRKNSFVIYQDQNKYLKIFQDGSCFCYKINKSNITKSSIKNVESDVYSSYFVNTNIASIKNDDFSNKKDYNNITKYSQIIFSPSNNFELIFERNICDKVKYNIYVKMLTEIDINDTKLAEVLNLISKKLTF